MSRLATFTAFLDANVLYSALVRDLLMNLTNTGLFRPKWSRAVQGEWIRNLLENRPDLTPDQLERTRELMDKHVPDALVTGYESLIRGLQLPDANDRHVLAAAIRGRADVIITENLKDFPAEILAPFGIKAQRYREGQEDQLGALGLVVNVIILWNTLYINAALEQLKAEGVSDPVRGRGAPLASGVRPYQSSGAVCVLSPRFGCSGRTPTFAESR